MKKFSKLSYVSLNYNSSIGYSLLIQGDNKSTRAVFCNAEDAAEYLEFKTGKVFSRNNFENGFADIRKLIVDSPDITRGIVSSNYVWSDGKFFTQTYSKS